MNGSERIREYFESARSFVSRVNYRINPIARASRLSSDHAMIVASSHLDELQRSMFEHAKTDPKLRSDMQEAGLFDPATYAYRKNLPSSRSEEV